MCSEKVLMIYFYDFKMLFQIFVYKEDTGQFFGETAYEKYNSHEQILRLSLRKKYLYLELFWSAYSSIRTEYGKMRTRITPNTDTFRGVYSFILLHKYVSEE